MPAVPEFVALEPWPRYGDTEPDARMQVLRRKVEEAQMHGDQAYACALTAAVANYEHLTGVVTQTAVSPTAEALRDFACDLHDAAGGWIGS